MNTNININVDLKEIEEIYYLLEELNDFFHDPNKYSEGKKLDDFVLKVYPSINKAYYNTVWNWLPKEVRDNIIT